MAKQWTPEELLDWSQVHSDAWHPGSRDDCADCQEMIRLYGEMPPVHLIEQASIRPASRPSKYAISDAERWTVWERDNFTCQHCGSRRDLTVDHIIPESKGGPNSIDNYQTLCRRCNSKKGTKDG